MMKNTMTLSLEDTGRMGASHYSGDAERAAVESLITCLDAFVVDLLDEATFEPAILGADDVREIMGLGAFEALIEKAER